jgi:hypothetical protein
VSLCKKPTADECSWYVFTYSTTLWHYIRLLRQDTLVDSSSNALKKCRWFRTHHKNEYHSVVHSTLWCTYYYYEFPLLSVLYLVPCTIPSLNLLEQVSLLVPACVDSLSSKENNYNQTTTMKKRNTTGKTTNNKQQQQTTICSTV